MSKDRRDPSKASASSSGARALAREQSLRGANRSATPSHAGSDEPYCWVLRSGEQERPVATREEYESLIAEADQHHLYLNLLDGRKERSRAGGRRDATRRFRSVAVPTVQAIALVEVMCAEGGLREKDLYVETTRGRQTIQEGRQKLDLRLPDGQWRSIKTLPGDHPSETRFILRPEEGVRYLLLHNLPEVRKKQRSPG